MWLTRAWVDPAPSQVTNSRRRCAAGICSIASVNTSIWSLAVLDPARPGRSLITKDSWVLSHHAVRG